MKNKTKFLLIVAIAVTFMSCDKIKDLTTVDISTKVNMDIPVAVAVEAQAVASKSATAVQEATFSESGTYNLTDNGDISKYVDLLKSATVESVEINFTGLQEGQTINSITLNIDGVGDIITLTDVTSANSVFTPTISQTLLTSIGLRLYTTQSITATVDGTTNVAPMTFSVKLGLTTLFTAKCFVVI